jgi:hypothetical protein
MEPPVRPLSPLRRPSSRWSSNGRIIAAPSIAPRERFAVSIGGEVTF